MKAEEILKVHKQNHDCFDTCVYEDQEIISILNAFAAYKLEEVREEAKEQAEDITNLAGDTGVIIYFDDLNNIFDEKLKELK